MRDWLRKRLDAFETRQEQRDEEFAALLTSAVDALSHRRTLWTYLAILGSANAIIWLSVIVFPRDVMGGWFTVTDLDHRFGAVLIAILFGIGMWFTYSLFRLKFPDLENPKFQHEVLSSFNYSMHTTKRWRVWLFAVIGGVLNVLLLVILELFRIEGLPKAQ